MRARDTAGRGGGGERGAALLVVIVSVAILTALAAELAYETRVSLEIAAGARDELRATYLAKSGVALSRMVLGFQQQIDDAAKAACGLASGIGQPRSPGQRGRGGAPAQPAPPCPRPQIWSAVPVGSALVQSLFGGAAPAEATPGEPARAAFGELEGTFEAKIEDEGRKVNAQLDWASQSTGTARMQVLALYQLVCDPRWDPLFEREDANGTRTSRQDLLMHLHDWVDPDKTSSSLVAGFPGPACLMEAGNPPFENGFGDENFPYDKGQERYRAKNARLDSIEELFLVAGVNDPLMAAFADRLTVYLPPDAPRNVNTSNQGELVELARALAEPGQLGLLDPEFGAKLQQAISDQTLGGLMTIAPQQFVATLRALGVPVNENALGSAAGGNQILTDQSFVFRIRATGSAGAVAKRIDAVVSFDPNQNRDAQAQVQQLQATATGVKPSRILRWREE